MTWTRVTLIFEHPDDVDAELELACSIDDILGTATFTPAANPALVKSLADSLDHDDLACFDRVLKHIKEQNDPEVVRLVTLRKFQDDP